MSKAPCSQRLKVNYDEVLSNCAFNFSLPRYTKADFCKGLGADEVIDYKSKEWSEVLAGQEYDLVFDCIGAEADWVACSKVGTLRCNPRAKP
jgi:D-arabinose 1-dehydrogenase-like Zn-dependent alcohol dehydrogenase